MKILSWDVGVRNLAYCILEKKDKPSIENKELNKNESDANESDDNLVKILDWNVIDLIGEVPDTFPTCQGILKSEKNCKKKSKIISDDGYYCMTHKPKNQEYQSLIAKKVCCLEVGTKNKKKPCSRKIFYQSLDKKYYCKNHGKSIPGLNIIKKDLSYYELCQMIIQKLEGIPGLFDVDAVVIENQPTLKNPKMKTIQVMLFSLFVMRDVGGRIKNVGYISATNKLKEAYQKVDISQLVMPNNKKAARKKLGIIYTQELLANQPEMIEFLKIHTKKDDLCDSYLQGLYYIEKQTK